MRVCLRRIDDILSRALKYVDAKMFLLSIFYTGFK